MPCFIQFNRSFHVTVTKIRFKVVKLPRSACVKVERSILWCTQHTRLHPHKVHEFVYWNFRGSNRLREWNRRLAICWFTENSAEEVDQKNPWIKQWCMYVFVYCNFSRRQTKKIIHKTGLYACVGLLNFGRTLRPRESWIKQACRLQWVMFGYCKL